jgi:carboxypeptidase Q
VHRSLALAVALVISASVAVPARQAGPPNTPPPAPATPAPPVVPTPVALTDAQRDAVSRIVGAAVTDDTAWRRLAYLSDRVGNRISGSPQLETAVAWALEEMKRDGLDDVHAEKVMVPHWVRGSESAELIEPTARRLNMLGLGGSVGTPPEGVTAEVVVVHDFAELDALGERARGKIVCYDVPFTNYGATVQYRGAGASRAAKYGAVAVFVRSVTPSSLDTPHTGALRYDDAVAKIPAAAITVEAAATLSRMQARGERVLARLKMEAKTLPDAESANVVGELRGSEHPEQIVLLGGHLDSWDVGTGSHDDGGGCVQVWEALRTIKRLGLKPKRTIRVVLFTNEENGTRGGTAYRDAHKAELADHVLAIETDSGTFRPLGFGVTAPPAVASAFAGVVQLLAPIGADAVGGEGGGADIGPAMREGVPGAGLNVEGSTYFYYHHTNADTLDKVDPKDLNLCVAALAVVAYVVADMPNRLGR